MPSEHRGWTGRRSVPRTALLDTVRGPCLWLSPLLDRFPEQLMMGPMSLTACDGAFMLPSCPTIFEVIFEARHISGMGVFDNLSLAMLACHSIYDAYVLQSASSRFHCLGPGVYYSYLPALTVV